MNVQVGQAVRFEYVGPNTVEFRTVQVQKVGRDENGNLTYINGWDDRRNGYRTFAAKNIVGSVEIMGV